MTLSNPRTDRRGRPGRGRSGRRGERRRLPAQHPLVPAPADHRVTCAAASACSEACSSPAWSLVGILLLTALCAPLIAPYGFADTSADGTRFGTQQPPSAAHLLGTTVTGFDVLSRVIWGTRTAVAVMACAVAALPVHRGRARTAVRLRRRLAGPAAGDGGRRGLRLPLPAAGDRDVDRDLAADSPTPGAASPPPPSRSPWCSSRSTSE